MTPSSCCPRKSATSRSTISSNVLSDFMFILREPEPWVSKRIDASTINDEVSAAERARERFEKLISRFASNHDSGKKNFLRANLRDT